MDALEMLNKYSGLAVLAVSVLLTFVFLRMTYAMHVMKGEILDLIEKKYLPAPKADGEYAVTRREFAVHEAATRKEFENQMRVNQSMELLIDRYHTRLGNCEDEISKMQLTKQDRKAAT